MTLGIYLPCALAVAMNVAVIEPSKAASCDGSESSDPQGFALAVEDLQNGRYDEFVATIDATGALPAEKRANLASGLNEISGSGFESCSVLLKRDDINARQYVVMLRQGDRHLFAYFLVGEIDANWLLLKTQVSTDLDEIFALVR